MVFYNENKQANTPQKDKINISCFCPPYRQSNCYSNLFRILLSNGTKDSWYYLTSSTRLIISLGMQILQLISWPQAGNHFQWQILWIFFCRQSNCFSHSQTLRYQNTILTKNTRNKVRVISSIIWQLNWQYRLV